MYSFFPFPQSFSQHKTIPTITFPCNRSSFFLSITPSSNCVFSSSFFYNTVYSTLLNHFLVLSDSQTLPPMNILPIVSADIVSCTNNFEPSKPNTNPKTSRISWMYPYYLVVAYLSLDYQCCSSDISISRSRLNHFIVRLNCLRSSSITTHCLSELVVSPSKLDSLSRWYLSCDSRSLSTLQYDLIIMAFAYVHSNKWIYFCSCMIYDLFPALINSSI